MKILSLAIAILVWLLVVNINNPISTKSFIVSDVELLNEAYIDADGKMCMQDEEQVSHPCDDQSSEKRSWTGSHSMIFVRLRIFSRR